MRRRATASAPARGGERDRGRGERQRQVAAARPSHQPRPNSDCERGGDERRSTNITCRRCQFGQRFAEQPMRAIAGEDGGKRADQERRVRRAAIEADAREPMRRTKRKTGVYQPSA